MTSVCPFELKTELDRLAGLMQMAKSVHDAEPASFYLDEGYEKNVMSCHVVFTALQDFASVGSLTFLESEELVPQHPAFRLIKRHIGELRYVYQRREGDLVQRFMVFSLARHPLPLRHNVLQSMSLFSGRLRLVKREEMIPAQFLGVVDGYLDFVIPLGVNVLRLALLGANGKTARLPAVVQFVEATDVPKAREMAAGVAAVASPRNQVDAFISVLSGSRGSSDFLGVFERACVSPDGSLATAIAMMAAEPAAFEVARSLLAILRKGRVLTHFYRLLGVALRSRTSNMVIRPCPELTAATNLFIALAMPALGVRVHEVMARGDAPMSELVSWVVGQVTAESMPEAVGLLRGVLGVCSLDDPTASLAPAVFLEIVVKPFAAALKQAKLYGELIAAFAEGHADVLNTARSIRCKVDEVVGSMPGVAGGEVDSLMVYEFVGENAAAIGRILIWLNGRELHESPVIQLLRFSYDRTKLDEC